MYALKRKCTKRDTTHEWIERGFIYKAVKYVIITKLWTSLAVASRCADLAFSSPSRMTVNNTDHFIASTDPKWTFYTTAKNFVALPCPLLKETANLKTLGGETKTEVYEINSDR